MLYNHAFHNIQIEIVGELNKLGMFGGFMPKGKSNFWFSVSRKSIHYTASGSHGRRGPEGQIHLNSHSVYLSHTLYHLPDATNILGLFQEFQRIQSPHLLQREYVLRLINPMGWMSSTLEMSYCTEKSQPASVLLSIDTSVAF